MMDAMLRSCIVQKTLKNDISTVVETVQARDRNPQTMTVPCPHVRLMWGAQLFHRAPAT